MIDRAAYLELADQFVPGADPELLIGLPELAWRLLPADEAVPSSPWASIGGKAPLVQGEKWPRNARGVPLTFVATLSTAQMPAKTEQWAAADWGHQGHVLRLFADLVDDPYDAVDAVVLTVAPGTELKPKAAPKLPSPYPPDGPQPDMDSADRVRVIKAQNVATLPMLTIPEPEECARRIDGHTHGAWREFAYALRRLTDSTADDGDERLRKQEEMSSRLEELEPGPELDSLMWEYSEMGFDSPAGPDPWSYSHILGFPVSNQEDVREHGVLAYPEAGDANDWVVLLSVHSGLGSLTILEEGSYNILVPRADLEAGRYERVVFAAESG